MKNANKKNLQMYSNLSWYAYLFVLEAAKTIFLHSVVLSAARET